MQRYTKERIYVRVRAEFDKTGRMMPCEIVWEDGRRFRIERVVDFFPVLGTRRRKYTVQIHGERRDLFYEDVIPECADRSLRWFVEREHRERVMYG